MPIPYVSQFVPTNMQALQSVLGEYQQAHDQNLARELGTMDQYSVIPTVSPGDTSEKATRLNQFSDKVKELTKKYNFDRSSSAYTKELAREISNIRQDPFWTYNERKKSVMDLDQKMKAQLGANYFSPNDPLSATFENQEAIDNYQPMNLQDLRQMMSSLANEYATSQTKDIGRVRNITNPVTGIVDSFVELGTQYGFEDADQAAEWLGTEPGQEWLMNSIKSTPFGQYADNATIASVARGAAMEKLVGQKDTSMQRLSQPSTDSGKTGGLGGLTKVSNTINVEGADGGNIRDLRQKEDTGRLSDDDQVYLDAVWNEVKSQPKSQQTFNRGIKRLSGTPLDGKLREDQIEDAYHMIMKEFEMTTQATRKSHVTKTMERTGKLGAAAASLLLPNAPITSRLELAKSTSGMVNVDNFKDSVRANLNEQFGLNLSEGDVKKIINKMKPHYNGDYIPNVENVINKRLKDGVTMVGDVMTLPVGTTSAQRGQLKEHLLDISEFMMPVGNEFKGTKDSQIWSKKFNEYMANMEPDNVLMSVVKNDNGMPTIMLKDRANTKGEALQFTINPTRQSLEVFERLAQFFGDSEFLDDTYRGMMQTPINRVVKFEDNQDMLVPIMTIFGNTADPNNAFRKDQIMQTIETNPEGVYDALNNVSWQAIKAPNGQIIYEVNIDGATGRVGTKNELIRALQNYILAKTNTLNN